MSPARLVVAFGALGVMVVACAVETEPPDPGSGGSSGAPGSGGVGTGGTTGGASGMGQSGSGGSGAGTGGSAGSTSSGGVGGSGNAGAGGAVSTGGLSGAGGGAGAGGSAANAGSGGAEAGGTAGAGGAVSTGGMSGAGGGAGAGAGGTAGTSGGGAGMGGTGGAIPLKNPPVPSAGCGKATTVTNGKKTITSTGEQREYIIDIPANYDMNKPYRLFYTSHWINARAEDVQGQNYYFLKPLAQAANEPAIFVAPQSDDGTWAIKDHALFDDLLAFVKQNLCIDTTRVFATGFSFGGMITYSLSVNHQKDIRAGVGIAPANYNIDLPTKTREPIAWMQTTGMGDGTCPWVNNESSMRGAKFIAIEHATDNGCVVPADIPIWQQGNHVCYDFQGCDAGYPTKACTFDGGHTNIDNENNTNWIAQESWDFFTQF
jgi:hypothetical protein